MGSDTVLLDTTWQGTTIEYTISAGTDYQITVGKLETYITPSTGRYSASSGNTREINLVYTYIPVGTHYWTSDNEFYTPTAWENVSTTIQSKKLGIIVSDGIHRVCVIKVEELSEMPEYSDDVDTSCLEEVSTLDEALQKFNGYEATQAMRKCFQNHTGNALGQLTYEDAYIASLGEVSLVATQEDFGTVWNLYMEPTWYSIFSSTWYGQMGSVDKYYLWYKDEALLDSDQTATHDYYLASGTGSSRGENPIILICKKIP